MRTSLLHSGALRNVVPTNQAAEQGAQPYMTPSAQAPLNAFYTPTLLPAIEELLVRGVPRERIEAVFHRSLFELRTPFMRVPLVLSRRFWELALAHTQDPAIGLAAGRNFLSTLTNGLTYLFDAAASLQSACDYFVEHFSFFNGHFRAEVVRSERGIELRLHDCGSLRAIPAITDYTLIGICSMLRRKLLASGLEQDPIIAVLLAHPAPGTPCEHAQALRTEVCWEQPYHAIRLDPQLFTRPLTPGNHQLEQTLVDLLRLAQSNCEATLLEQVCDQLVMDLPSGAGLQRFCDSHHLLERTAARRLKAQGWTFSELLDEYRRGLAEDLLETSTLELAAISDRLGYGDVQSFNRACLRWFGIAPGQYRQRRCP